MFDRKSLSSFLRERGLARDVKEVRDSDLPVIIVELVVYIAKKEHELTLCHEIIRKAMLSYLDEGLNCNNLPEGEELVRTMLEKMYEQGFRFENSEGDRTLG